MSNSCRCIIRKCRHKGAINQQEYEKLMRKMDMADLAERTGEWIMTDDPDEQTYRCSACDEIWTFIVGTPFDNGAYFCPNCGARMEL